MGATFMLAYCSNTKLRPIKAAKAVESETKMRMMSTNEEKRNTFE